MTSGTLNGLCEGHAGVRTPLKVFVGPFFSLFLGEVSFVKDRKGSMQSIKGSRGKLHHLP